MYGRLFPSLKGVIASVVAEAELPATQPGFVKVDIFEMVALFIPVFPVTTICSV